MAPVPGGVATLAGAGVSLFGVSGDGSGCSKRCQSARQAACRAARCASGGPLAAPIVGLAPSTFGGSRFLRGARHKGPLKQYCRLVLRPAALLLGELR